MIKQENLICEVFEESLEAINKVTEEIQKAMFKIALPLATVAAVSAIYSMVSAKGNSDLMLSASEHMADAAKDLELLSRVSAFIEDARPAQEEKEKMQVLQALFACMQEKTENDNVLYVEEVEGEFKFTLLAEMPAAPAAHNRYGYFAI
jgi:hypothetical protein